MQLRIPIRIPLILITRNNKFLRIDIPIVLGIGMFAGLVAVLHEPFVVLALPFFNLNISFINIHSLRLFQLRQWRRALFHSH